MLDVGNDFVVCKDANRVWILAGSLLQVFINLYKLFDLDLTL